MKIFPWLLAACVAANWSALAQNTATVDIDTAQTTPLNPNFSGFNDEVVFPAEFFDYRLNEMRPNSCRAGCGIRAAVSAMPSTGRPA